MGAAVLGIYGNSKQEAMYPAYAVDADGKKLDGANKYTVHFAADKLPPVNAFWSLTMYDLPQSLLVANPINRYLLNSPMLPQFVKDADGGLTFYIQNESPGKDKEPNWLPAPKGPFFIAMRLYWPKSGSARWQLEAAADEAGGLGAVPSAKRWPGLVIIAKDCAHFDNALLHEFNFQREVASAIMGYLYSTSCGPSIRSSCVSRQCIVYSRFHCDRSRECLRPNCSLPSSPPRRSLPISPARPCFMQPPRP